MNKVIYSLIPKVKMEARFVGLLPLKCDIELYSINTIILPTKDDVRLDIKIDNLRDTFLTNN